MAMCDYARCHKCQGKAFYDANISDPGYCATWDPSEEVDPIGIAVLCADCAKSYEVVIRPIEGPRERVRHIKRGSTYQVVGRGKLQTDAPLSDLAELVIYQSEADGTFWVRPVGEFYDGRFEITSPESAP